MSNPMIYDIGDNGGSSGNAQGHESTTAEQQLQGLHNHRPTINDVLHGHTAIYPRKATLLSCYINLSNTILGSGILGLPYAFR